MAIVLITGTSTGIGLATAVACARAGHEVYATMRDPARAPQLQTLARQEGLPVSVLPLDVDNDASVQWRRRAALGSAGTHRRPGEQRRHCAYGRDRRAPVGGVPPRHGDQLLRGFTVHPGRLAHDAHTAPGCIINVSSVAGRIALAATAAYTASKFALEALSEVLAQEVKAFNIRVAIVEPGVI